VWTGHPAALDVEAPIELLRRLRQVGDQEAALAALRRDLKLGHHPPRVRPASCNGRRSCGPFPRDYLGAIRQSAQEGVLFHADAREELILKINYKIEGETLRDRFAWVVTVPNKPDHYRVADKNLFKDVYTWARKLLLKPRPRSRSKENSKAKSLGGAHSGLLVGKPVQVGPYTIQPVRALGEKALGALNRWLSENGFPTEDPDHMRYFVLKNFTFVCIKFQPPRGRTTVERTSGVPPLQLSFKTKHPYYPLRFSSRQGVFDVNLYVLTKRKFDYVASRGNLARINNYKNKYIRTNVPITPVAFPEVLQNAYRESRFKGYTGRWYLNLLQGPQVNRNNSIAKWKTDIFFKTRG
jgi:hypothetical protein